MTSLRLDCVFYYVEDLDRAVHFYTAVLGLRLSSRDVVARFDVDGLLLELVPAGHPDLLSGRGNARLALAVEDIQTTAAELRSRGAAVSEVQHVSNGWLASLRDPDSNEIVLWQYA